MRINICISISSHDQSITHCEHAIECDFIFPANAEYEAQWKYHARLYDYK